MEAAIAIITWVVETVLTVQKNQSLADINNRLAQIEQRLAVIEAKLDEALEILRHLNVYFKEAGDYEARQRVLKSWKIVLRKYPVWTASPSNIKQYTAEIRHEYDLLSREAADLAMRESFANFHVMAIAMATENDLIRLLPDQEPFRQRIFQEYADYFLGVGDPKKVGSVAVARLRVEEAKNAIEKGHNDLPKPLYHPISSEDRRGRCTYQLAEPIIGSLQEGYRFKGEHCFYREINCREPEGRGGERGGGGADADVVTLSGGSKRVLLSESSVFRDNYGRFFCTVNYQSPSIPQLEAERARYNRLNGDLKELDAAAEIAKKLQIHAATLTK